MINKRRNTAWDIRSILKQFVRCADILLIDKGYDGHNWEAIHYAKTEAEKIINGEPIEDNEK